MPDLVSPSDKKLLADYDVKVEIDAQQKCGYIIFDNRRLKVTLESQKGKGSALKPVTLEAEQMTETANKVAVMLLKKEYLQTVTQKPMNFLINATVIAFRSEKQFLKHEDSDKPEFNTRQDYDDLAKYVNNYLPKEEVAEEDLFASDTDEDLFASDAEEADLLAGDSEEASDEAKAQRSAVDPKAGIGERRYYHTNRLEDFSVTLAEVAQHSQKKEDEEKEREMQVQKSAVPPPVEETVVQPSKEDEFDDSEEEDENRGVLSKIGRVVYNVLLAGSE